MKAKGNRRAATSDWMELERNRGISITSTVLQFNYRGCVVNLLDTPGHQDFSEDTYRVLAAADAAVMVLDAAKGIEAQTRKLFEVCRERSIPIVTFINKWDRPSRDPLELLDEIEDQLVLEPVPITWPVGDGDEFAGVINRRTGDFVKYTRTARGATIAPEVTVAAQQINTTHTDTVNIDTAQIDAWAEASEALELFDALGTNFNAERFLQGELSPVFYGSALTNFGVRLLLDAVVDFVPHPQPRIDANNARRPLDAPFSAIVFKIQANMNKAHRDRIAFLRVCSGKFERGMTVKNGATGKSLSTKYAHAMLGRDRSTAEEAWPGDVIGLVSTENLRPGDAIYEDEPVTWPSMPQFAPSCFKIASSTDTSKTKQFRSGIQQLDTEGVVQVLRRPEDGQSTPILAAVGPLQFDVVIHRLTHEFGAPTQLAVAPWNTARRTNAESAQTLKRMTGVTVAERASGELLALFESAYWLQRLQTDYPELHLEPLVGEGL